MTPSRKITRNHRQTSLRLRRIARELKISVLDVAVSQAHKPFAACRGGSGQGQRSGKREPGRRRFLSRSASDGRAGCGATLCAAAALE